jgi:hypothetical protein
MFDLSENKSSAVAEMSTLGWEIGWEVWVWRRQLWVWEKEQLRVCQDLLHDLIFQAQSFDSWQWRHDPDRGYSVTLNAAACHFGCSCKSYLAQTSSLEGFYFCMETLT